MKMQKAKLSSVISGLVLAAAMTASAAVFAEGGKVVGVKGLNNVFYESWEITYKPSSGAANKTCSVGGTTGAGQGTVGSAALVLMQNPTKFTSTDLLCTTYGMQISVWK